MRPLSQADSLRWVFSMKDRERVEEWLRGAILFPRGMWAFDSRMYSYADVIAERTVAGGMPVIRTWLRPSSRTTDTHRRMIERAAERLGIQTVRCPVSGRSLGFGRTEVDSLKNVSGMSNSFLIQRWLRWESLLPEGLWPFHTQVYSASDLIAARAVIDMRPAVRVWTSPASSTTLKHCTLVLETADRLGIQIYPSGERPYSPLPVIPNESQADFERYAKAAEGYLRALRYFNPKLVQQS